MVDSRIYNTTSGERPHHLLRTDLPVVARAIVAVVRKQGHARAGVLRQVPYVRLLGRDFDLSILGSDWEKILPYIQDGTFDPIIVPASPQTGYLSPDTQYDSATLDDRDSLFYERVLRILQGLFPGDYPTSNL